LFDGVVRSFGDLVVGFEGRNFDERLARGGIIQIAQAGKQGLFFIRRVFRRRFSEVAAAQPFIRKISLAG
jgi:hypothetical protein